ncbi:hypothetical protein BGZ93_008202 [Podila epicladia]|nr:hypothetical protein BGZ93_008202 [Podila epicladia]
MSETSQKFKFDLTEKELNLVSSNVPSEPLFTYVDDVLKAFKIPDVDRFEADGKTIAYSQDGYSNILALIQSKIEAILSQQLELDGYPIPPLFIILPEELAKYNPGNWFRTKFRLHFICECGEHTEALNSKVPHYLHLAKHEGYVIRDPTEFFKKYGSFLLLILDLIKFGTSIAGQVKTSDGRVKWVCLDHYRASYQETQTQKPHDAVKVARGKFDKQLGKITVTLTSSFAASEFYNTIRNTKGVLELIMNMSRECTWRDL